MWPDGPRGVDRGVGLCYTYGMEPIDFRKLGAAKLVLCTATEVGAGIETGSAEYLVYISLSREVRTERCGEVPDVSDAVPDRDGFLAALDRAAADYVDWCSRFVYMRKRENMFKETEFHFHPSHIYKVVMWVALEGDDYVFSFMPLREAGKVEAGTADPNAHSVPVPVNGGR